MKILQELWKGMALLLILTGAGIKNNAQSFDRKNFYSAMASGNAESIETQISLLKSWSSDDKPAFEGALLMKKAGLLKGASQKLSLFKDGRKKLEAAILKNGDNAEYRFLRLMIQEHAPGMLGYKNDLDKDSMYIRQSYKKLPAEIQQAIADYSKTSKVLKPGDFNF